MLSLSPEAGPVVPHVGQARLVHALLLLPAPPGDGAEHDLHHEWTHLAELVKQSYGPDSIE